jgi:hypothetical protein
MSWCGRLQFNAKFWMQWSDVLKMWDLTKVK